VSLGGVNAGSVAGYFAAVEDSRAP
jgi:hypothetical protein